MKRILLLYFFIISVSGCKSVNSLERYEFSTFSMNTLVSVTIYHNKLNKSILKKIEKQTISILEELEKKYSISKNESIVNQLKRTNEINIDNEIYQILKSSERFYKISERKFDITIGRLIDVWGFYNQKYRLPDRKEIESAKRLTGFEKIQFTHYRLKVNNAIWVDFGGILKGYAVEKVAAYLKSEGIIAGLVNAGGNIKVFGEKPDKSPWKIGIRHPRKNGELYKVITLSSDEAIATSGDYERFFITNGIRYHHIIDPGSGYPVKNNIASVTVVTTNAMEADGYSTTLFLLGIEKGIKLANREKIKVLYLVSKDNMDVYKTNNIDF
ncbi:MAG: FAD:protein FMN transferase [Brevinematia bacterium]